MLRVSAISTLTYAWTWRGEWLTKIVFMVGGLNCPLCRPNSITKAYEAHPVAISLWVTLLICILSGMSVLFRGTAVAHAKSGSGSIRVGRNSPIEKIENDPMESEEPVRRGREVVKEGED